MPDNEMSAEERALSYVYSMFGIATLGELSGKQPNDMLCLEAIKAASAAAQERGRREGLEEAMRAVCIYCGDGWPLNEAGTEHTLKPGARILMPAGRCSAIAIRSRLTQKD